MDQNVQSTIDKASITTATPQDGGYDYLSINEPVPTTSPTGIKSYGQWVTSLPPYLLEKFYKGENTQKTLDKFYNYYVQAEMMKQPSQASPTKTLTQPLPASQQTNTSTVGGPSTGATSNPLITQQTQAGATNRPLGVENIMQSMVAQLQNKMKGVAPETALRTMGGVGSGEEKPPMFGATEPESVFGSMPEGTRKGIDEYTLLKVLQALSGNKGEDPFQALLTANG